MADNNVTGAAKRVVHVSSAHSADDVRIFHKEARSLAAAGYDVHLVAPGCTDGHREGVTIHCVTRSTSRWARFLFGAPRALRVAARLHGSVYHLHDPELVPWFFLLPSSATLIFDAHEDLPAQVSAKEWIPEYLRSPMSKLAGLIERAVARWFTAAVVVTPTMQGRFGSLPTVLVRNLPISSEWQSVRRRVDDNQPYVVFAGGIWPSRGIEQMVEAIALTDTSVHLVLAGPIQGAGVVEMIESNKESVRYEGVVDRQVVGELLSRATAGLLVYLPEPNHVNAMPHKLFEYMSAGLPVIASDFPMWRSLVEEHECGLLVDPEDSAAIAKAIDWLAANPSDASQMGQRGRAAVSSGLSWDEEQVRLLELYERLLQD